MRNKIVVTILGILACFVAGVIVGFVVHARNMPEVASTAVSDSSTIDETDSVSSDSVTVTDVDEGTNARSASNLESVPIVAEVVEMNKSRGFGDLPIIVDFDTEGNYSDLHVVDTNTDLDKKFAVYHMLYTTPDQIMWTIYVNDGTYLAVPLGKSEQVVMKEIIFSETDYTVNYDGSTNEYSNIKLDTLTDEVGVQVERIDAKTLDSYSIDDLLKL